MGSTSSAILNIRLRSARIALVICLVRFAGASDGNGTLKTACLDRRRDQALDRTRAAEDECAIDREAAWTPHSFCQTTRFPIGIDSAGGRTSIAGLASAIRQTLGRHFCIVPASSAAMYAHSNPSAIQKTHRARCRATSMQRPRRARSFAGTEDFEKSRRERKKIEMRFAHLKRILKLDRLRLRGPRGAQDEFVLAAIAQNLRRLVALVARGSVHRVSRGS
jgi:hypothetical protein